MENQISDGDQNIQQAEQNPVNQSLPILERPKVNNWMILAIILLIVLIGGAVFVFSFSSFTQKAVTLTNLSPSPKNELQNLALQTLSLSSTDLNDSETELYFSDANKLYKVSLNGSQPQDVATLPHNISTISILPNGTLLISTDNSKYEKVTNKQPGDSDYKQVAVGYGYWKIESNSTKPEELDEQKYQTLTRFKDNTNGERIYTKELSNGQAEILADRLDGSSPTKVGLLKEKLLSTQVCEVGENCLEKQHPGEFIPSFDGKFLLNKPPGGGGLGIPGVVVSRDGSKVYEINFYWYVSSAIWIANNKLLIKAQDGKQKIYTFNEDGTFNESFLEQDLGGYFSLNSLSPTKKYLLIDNANPVGISLFDFDKGTIISVEKEDREKLIQQYSLQDEVQIDPRINHLFGIIGWNKKGDKFLYSEQISPFASTETAEKLEIREIKIFDMSAGKIYTVAKLYPRPANPDEYLLQGKPVANVGQFVIR